MTLIYLSTKSKKTRKQREKEKDAWELYKQKYGLVENKARTQQIVKTTPVNHLKVLRPGAMDFKSIPSREEGSAIATKPTRNVYTGDKLVGIATMHKSNLVPIFNTDAAEDVAKMRR
jgi:hypothetical protein